VIMQRYAKNADHIILVIVQSPVVKTWIIAHATVAWLFVIGETTQLMKIKATHHEDRVRMMLQVQSQPI